MKKAQKATLINQYIAENPTQVSADRQPKVEILEDGRIEYTILSNVKLGNGKHYRMKSSYREILMTLPGLKMRELHARLQA